MDSQTTQIKALKTAELMGMAEVGRNTLRFYETRGLIKGAARTQAGYRLYTYETLEDLKFIKHAKACGFSLKEINDLLSILRTESSTCGSVSKRIEPKIAEIDALIVQLNIRKALLKKFSVTCSSKNKGNNCDIRGQGFKKTACGDKPARVE